MLFLSRAQPHQAPAYRQLGAFALVGLLGIACDANRMTDPAGDDPTENGDGEGDDDDDDDDDDNDDDVDSMAQQRCSADDLVWKSARKTTYTSHPDPDSPECDDFNGCEWAGLFAGCSDKRPESWVAAHDIAAVFPNFNSLAHHELCIRKGNRVMIVNVIDTCSDSDCDGCCTDNLADHDALVDLEFHTNSRWGRPDETIEWADLGRRERPICE